MSRKSIIGALALCALALCAFGAASASAAGLTAAECKKPGGSLNKYNTSECLTPGTTGEFETVQLPLNTAVKVTGTHTTPEHKLGSTATTPVAIFHSTLGGAQVTITCGKGTTTGGTVTNKTVGEVMQIHGQGGSTTWEECHAELKSNPARKCVVQGVAPATAKGTVKTNPLTSITTGTEHNVTISPEGGLPFTVFNILPEGTECFFGATVKVEVTGKVGGEANTSTHSHLTLNEANNGGELKANGTKSNQTETIQFKNTETGNLIGSETF